jgi:DNA-binding CsgD family transcriptional regulator
VFITLRTVETHLTHAHAKLDINTREQLTTALGRESDPAASSPEPPTR